MAGIYIHIPFCKQACHYCDFHFSTSLTLKDKMIEAISQEIKLRSSFLNSDEPIKTIYFGGGTPSILERNDIENILAKIDSTFILDHPEITMEVNPDDIDTNKLSDWKKLGVNRLSLGIQSFQDKALTFMNRAHSSAEAFRAIELIKSHGFDNINLDFIFGIQTLSHDEFEADLETFISLRPNHISAYCLTIEDGTVFGKKVKKGELEDVSEEVSSKQYLQVSDQLTAAGYCHYEISNYGLPNQESKHNTSYWEGEKYLGIGPSAHSFDGNTRFFNIANNPKYIKALEQNLPFYDSENLTLENKINEYILTRLRTSKGINLNLFESLFGNINRQHLTNKTSELIRKDFVEMTSYNICLTRKGKLLADSVCESLFCEL